MNRRGFLGTLVKASAAVVAAPLLTMLPKPKPKLAFHPDAFELVMPMPNRMDVLYGYGVVRPELTCRVWEA